MGESRGSVILGDMGHSGGVAGTVILRLMGEGSGGHCNSGSKLPRRNVVNISMEVLCSIFREL